MCCICVYVYIFIRSLTIFYSKQAEKRRFEKVGVTEGAEIEKRVNKSEIENQREKRTEIS